MTDLENHMTIGPVSEYEGDYTDDARKADIDNEITYIFEHEMDGDFIFEAISEADDSASIDIADAVTDQNPVVIGNAIMAQVIRYIRKVATHRADRGELRYKG